MAKLSKKFKQENSFFLKGKNRQRIEYNEKCKNCQCECKQSYKAKTIFCPYYTPLPKGNSYDKK